MLGNVYEKCGYIGSVNATKTRIYRLAISKQCLVMFCNVVVILSNVCYSYCRKRAGGIG